MSTETTPALSVPQNEEIELLKQQDDHQFQLANRQLEANLEDRRETRDHFRKIHEVNSKRGIMLCMTALFLFFGFGALALWLGKEALLSDLLKVFVGAFGGGGIGYIIGFRHKQQSS